MRYQYMRLMFRLGSIMSSDTTMLSSVSDGQDKTQFALAAAYRPQPQPYMDQLQGSSRRDGSGLFSTPSCMLADGGLSERSKDAPRLRCQSPTQPRPTASHPGALP